MRSLTLPVVFVLAGHQSDHPWPAPGFGRSTRDPWIPGPGGHACIWCQHAYPHSSNAFLKTDFEPQLKGADACLVAVARDLGLKSEIKPLYKREHDDYG